MHGKYLFRAWAVAEEPRPRRDGAIAPTAPYALDFEAGDTREERDKSTSRVAYSQGWSKDQYSHIKQVRSAGHRTVEDVGAADSLHDSNWQAPNWKDLKSNYMENCDSKGLARHHRRLEKSKKMPQSAREARWVKCFQQSCTQEGFGLKGETKTHITGTEYSLLPAGYTFKASKRIQPNVKAEVERMPSPSRQMQEVMLARATQGVAGRAPSAPGRAQAPASIRTCTPEPLSARPQQQNLMGLPQFAKDAEARLAANKLLMANNTGNSRKSQGQCQQAGETTGSRPPLGAFASGTIGGATVGNQALDPEQRLRNVHGWHFMAKFGRNTKNAPPGKREAPQVWTAPSQPGDNASVRPASVQN